MAIGFALLLAGWWRRAREIRAALAAASPVEFGFPIKVMSSPGILEPGVFGVLRPVLLLPEGIAARLTPEQLESVLAHELCHVRRRDNLTGVLHMIVEALFWFHPLIWWLGARLMEERERACDEEVLRLGNQPEVYAEGILKICDLYWESPLRCVSGVTGADLRKRIEEIMTNRSLARLSAEQEDFACDRRNTGRCIAPRAGSNECASARPDGLAGRRGRQNGIRCGLHQAEHAGSGRVPALSAGRR